MFTEKPINWNEFDVKLKKLQTKTIQNILKVSSNHVMNNISKTDDSFKYEMIRNNDKTYKSPVITAKVLAIVDMNGNIVTEPNTTKHGLTVSLVLDKTSFYCKAGGQNNDIGTIKTKNGKIFDIHNVEKIQDSGVVFHFIKSNDWPILLRYSFKFNALKKKKKKIQIYK